MKWLYYLTGGRPMKLIEDKVGFWDHIGQQAVLYWHDQFGRKWVAANRWSWFRVRVDE